MKKFLALLILSLLFSLQVVNAQEEPTFDFWGWKVNVRNLSGFWIIFLIAAFVSISSALIFKQKWSLYIGIIALYISIILVEICVLLPLFLKPIVAYEECKTMFQPDVSIITAPGLFYTISCIFTGYTPPNFKWLTVTTFVIFGVILPLALLLSLFWEFIPASMITSEKARRVIAVAGALFAFRGFFATFMIRMLEYGFAGIGALFVGTLFTGLVWKACEKFVSPLGIDVGTSLKIMKLGYYQELEEELEHHRKALIAAQKAGDTALEAEIQKRIDELEDLLKKAGKGKI